MSSPHTSKLLVSLADAWKAQADAERKLREARAATRQAEDKALAKVVPPAVKDAQFIPLTPTTGLVVHRVEMSPALTADRLPYWSARGHKVRFRVGVEESIGPGVVEQPAYEALSEDIRAMRREDMLKASREQKLTGMDAPLKLTDRQCQMFSMLANNNERIRFSAQPVEGGQCLPSAIWDSGSSTQSIWSAMVKRGVLDLTQGNLADPWNRWRVNPGPRFADAVALVAKHLHAARPNAPVTLEFYQAFGLTPPAAGSAPRPR